jgi:hypothetical protein
MIKKYLSLIILFILIGTGSVLYYNKTYIKEDKLRSDIQNRIKVNSKVNIVNYYKILQQKDMNNLKIVLYSYTANNLNLVECSVYEKTSNQRYKFIRGQQPGIGTGNMQFSTGSQKNRDYYFIHFGYIGDTDPNKYEITYANKTFIKEYNRNESFLELYYLNSGGVSIGPVYESKSNQ